jgi:4-amino-4-deoxy-L-arabinose transferase-like glycosyltransferase
MSFLLILNQRLAGSAHGWRSLFLALVCLVCFTPGITSLPPVDRDEARFTQATKQMAETGDYLDIRYQEVPRYKKPIGIYWLQSATLKLTGADPQSDIWAYRLVSVFGATLAVLVTAWLASFMFGGKAALAAGLFAASMFVLSFEARIAKTDAMLLACCVVAQAMLARAYLAHKTDVFRFDWLIFWIALGVGILIKGPVTPLLALLTVVTLYAIDRDLAWLKRLRLLPGVLVTALVAAPWLIAITMKSGGAFWAEAVGRDLLGKVAEGQESHGAPPGYYALIFALFIWPLPVIAVQGALAGLSRFKADRRVRFLLAWYVPWWLVIELTPTKLPHYILPVYPALVLLAVWLLCAPPKEAVAPSGHRWMINLTRLGLAVATVAIAALAVGLPVYNSGQISVLGILAAIIALATGFVGLNSNERMAAQPVLLAAQLAIGSALVWAIMAGNVLPGADLLWPSRQIAASFKSELADCAEPRLVSAGFHEPSLVMLAGTKTLLTDGKGAADALAAAPDCTLAAVQEDHKPAFVEALGVALPRLIVRQEINAVNYSKGREVNISIYGLTKP